MNGRDFIVNDDGVFIRVAEVALARMWYSSPDLLAAIIAVLPFIEDASDVHDLFPNSAASSQCRAAVAAAKAAISKATGESK